MNKICFKCNIEQPIDNFYKHAQMADGHLGKCKECTKLDTINNYCKNREYYMSYDKSRNLRPERIHWKVEVSRKWRKSHPDEYKAHQAVSSALKSGKIKKELCWCGADKVEAHHPDYSKPLDIMWLCNKHHKHIHGRKAF